MSRRSCGRAETETYAEPESFASLISSAGWPEIVASFPLTMPVGFLNDDPNSLLMSQSALSPPSVLFADVFRYLPASIFSTAGSVAPLVFQNWSSGLSHTAVPIMISRNETSCGMDTLPSQPLPCMSVRFMLVRCPESMTDPATWTAAAVFRSATALLAIWSALSVASGLAFEPALVPAVPALPQLAAPTAKKADASAAASMRCHIRVNDPAPPLATPAPHPTANQGNCAEQFYGLSSNVSRCPARSYQAVAMSRPGAITALYQSQAATRWHAPKLRASGQARREYGGGPGRCCRSPRRPWTQLTRQRGRSAGPAGSGGGTVRARPQRSPARPRHAPVPGAGPRQGGHRQRCSGPSDHGARRGAGTPRRKAAPPQDPPAATGARAECQSGARTTQAGTSGSPPGASGSRTRRPTAS